MKIKEIGKHNNYQIDFIQDYEPSDDVFRTTSHKVDILKSIIFNNLSYNERVIFLLYTECNGNYNKMANYIKIDSKQNLYIYISNIKKKIKQAYESYVESYSKPTDN